MYPMGRTGSINLQDSDLDSLTHIVLESGSVWQVRLWSHFLNSGFGHVSSLHLITVETV